MTHTKYVCCCHAWDEDACQVLGCDSNSKLAFGATTEADAMVCGHVPGKGYIVLHAVCPACRSDTFGTVLPFCIRQNILTMNASISPFI
jgi:hypothetical protein